MQFFSIHETILNSMSEAVYVVDRDMRIQYANPAAENLTGHSLSESMGKHCREIFCQETFQCKDTCPPLKAIMEAVPVLHCEAETRHKNGEVRRTQISIAPYFEGRECIGGVIVMKDVTELRAAQDRIRKQNTFLTAVIDALPHPLYVIDAETYEVKLANYAAYAGNISGKRTCYELSHSRSEPCSLSDHPCPFEKVKETGQPVVLEHIHRTSGGRDTHVEIHGYPIFDDKGKTVQMIEYCVDISERKQSMQEREKLIEDLQKALQEVKNLSGLLPICASCKKIRDDKGYWNHVESYISAHSEAEFTHGLCPDCMGSLYPQFFGK